MAREAVGPAAPFAGPCRLLRFRPRRPPIESHLPRLRRLPFLLCWSGVHLSLLSAHLRGSASPSALLLPSVARCFHEVSVACCLPEAWVRSVCLQLGPSAAFSPPPTLLEASVPFPSARPRPPRRSRDPRIYSRSSSLFPDAVTSTFPVVVCFLPGAPHTHTSKVTTMTYRAVSPATVSGAAFAWLPCLSS